jgi:hypothetical protein
LSNPYRALFENRVRTALDGCNASGGFRHKGLKGRAREIFIEEMLPPTLAPSIKACTGVVVDSSGNQSAQTDIIVYDRAIAPPALIGKEDGAIPCESVLVAVEIKSKLTRGELRKSLEWASSIKALRPTWHAFAAERQRVPSIPCVLFSMDTDLASAGGMAREAARLLSAVIKRYESHKRPRIGTPISALTIVSRGHVECTKASPDPSETRWDVRECKGVEAGLEFVMMINRVATAQSFERRAIPLDWYIRPR